MQKRSIKRVLLTTASVLAVSTFLQTSDIAEVRADTYSGVIVAPLDTSTTTDGDGTNNDEVILADDAGITAAGATNGIQVDENETTFTSNNSALPRVVVNAADGAAIVVETGNTVTTMTLEGDLFRTTGAGDVIETQGTGAITNLNLTGDVSLQAVGAGTIFNFSTPTNVSVQSQDATFVGPDITLPDTSTFTIAIGGANTIATTQPVNVGAAGTVTVSTGTWQSTGSVTGGLSIDGGSTAQFTGDAVSVDAVTTADNGTLALVNGADVDAGITGAVTVTTTGTGTSNFAAAINTTAPLTTNSVVDFQGDLTGTGALTHTTGSVTTGAIALNRGNITVGPGVTLVDWSNVSAITSADEVVINGPVTLPVGVAINAANGVTYNVSGTGGGDDITTATDVDLTLVGNTGSTGTVTMGTDGELIVNMTAGQTVTVPSSTGTDVTTTSGNAIFTAHDGSAADFTGDADSGTTTYTSLTTGGGNTNTYSVSGAGTVVDVNGGAPANLSFSVDTGGAASTAVDTAGTDTVNAGTMTYDGGVAHTSVTNDGAGADTVNVSDAGTDKTGATTLGTGGTADVLNVNAGASHTGNINVAAGGGNVTVNNTDGAIGPIAGGAGGAGAGGITLNNGGEVNTITGTPAADTFNFNTGTTFNGGATGAGGGGGGDTFNVASGVGTPATYPLNGDAGDDIFNLNPGTYDGGVVGGADNDTANFQTAGVYAFNGDWEFETVNAQIAGANAVWVGGAGDNIAIGTYNYQGNGAGTFSATFNAGSTGTLGRFNSAGTTGPFDMTITMSDGSTRTFADLSAVGNATNPITVTIANPGGVTTVEAGSATPNPFTDIDAVNVEGGTFNWGRNAALGNTPHTRAFTWVSATDDTTVNFGSRAFNQSGEAYVVSSAANNQSWNWDANLVSGTNHNVSSLSLTGTGTSASFSNNRDLFVGNVDVPNGPVTHTASVLTPLYSSGNVTWNSQDVFFVPNSNGTAVTNYDISNQSGANDFVVVATHGGTYNVGAAGFEAVTYFGIRFDEDQDTNVFSTVTTTDTVVNGPWRVIPRFQLGGGVVAEGTQTVFDGTNPISGDSNIVFGAPEVDSGSFPIILSPSSITLENGGRDLVLNAVYLNGIDATCPGHALFFDGVAAVTSHNPALIGSGTPAEADYLAWFNSSDSAQLNLRTKQMTAPGDPLVPMHIGFWDNVFDMENSTSHPGMIFTDGFETGDTDIFVGGRLALGGIPGQETPQAQPQTKPQYEDEVQKYFEEKPSENQLQFHARIFGDMTEQDAEAFSLGYDIDTYGAVAGVTGLMDDLSIGFFLAYATSDVDHNETGHTSEYQTYAVGGEVEKSYGNNFYVLAKAGFGFTEFEYDRVRPSADINNLEADDVASADADIFTFAGAIQGGHRFYCGDNMVLTPYVGLSAMHIDVEEYTESDNVENAANTYSEDDMTLVTGSVGMKFLALFGVDEDVIIIPNASVAVSYHFVNDAYNPSITNAALLENPTSVEYLEANDLNVSGSVGLKFIIDEDVTIFVDAQAHMGFGDDDDGEGDTTGYGGQAGVKIRF